MSQRKARVQREARRLVNDGYGNYVAGVTRLFQCDPRTSVGRAHIKAAFSVAYPVFEWCRTIRRVGRARYLLVELRSALATAIALATVGLYEVAGSQLRYACECIIAFLYFRDHPRELQLAVDDADQWDLTRPKVVVAFLKKLPEYRNPVGRDFLGALETEYANLCRYAHPRLHAFMGQRRYLTHIRPEERRASEFARAVRALSAAICGVAALGCREEYDAAGEVSRFVLRMTIKTAVRRRLEEQIGADNARS